MLFRIEKQISLFDSLSYYYFILYLKIAVKISSSIHIYIRNSNFLIK